LKIKDGLLAASPAFFFFILNLYIFILAISDI
jgi:hypothetical protein